MLQFLVLAGELPQLIFQLLNPDFRIGVLRLRKRRRMPREGARSKRRGQRSSADGFINPE